MIGSLIGLKIRQDDAEAAIEILIPYYLFILGYMIVTSLFFIYQKNRRNNSKLSKKPFFLSLTLLVVVPFIYSGQKAFEQYRHQKNIEKQEYTNYLSSLDHINSVIAKHPDSSLLYIKRGQLKRSQGFWEQSISDCKISLEVKESTEAYWELGWCQEHLGYLDQALVSYQRAATLDSSLNWPQKRINVVKRKMSKSH